MRSQKTKSKINSVKKTLDEKLNETFKSITESVELYPAGRGKVLILTKKKILPKPRNYKHKQARFAHTRIKSNPKDITITEYLQTDTYAPVKHIYLFPEGKQLTHKEREDLALSLLATLPHYTPRYLGESNPKKTPRKLPHKFPVFLNTQQRQILKRKYKRYDRWRKRHN